MKQTADERSCSAAVFYFSDVGISVQLCAGGNVGIDLEQMQLFLVVFFMDCADEHTAGFDAHHRVRRQVEDGD